MDGFSFIKLFVRCVLIMCLYFTRGIVVKSEGQFYYVEFISL